MSVAYWCVLFAAVMPYLTVGIAKAGGLSGGSYDNAAPRRPDTYSGLWARAHGAHQNSLEVFPFFAAAVIVASGAAPKASIPRLDELALAWVALRLIYAGVYIGNQASLRSLVWIAAFFVAVAIFTMPLWHG